LDGGSLLGSYGINLKVPPAPLYTIEQLKEVIEDAWSVTVMIGNLDMDFKQKQSYEKNRETLKSIANRLDINTTIAVVFHGARNVGQEVIRRASNTAKNASSGGCYIATMAYGDYDHPQVLILRDFRDEILNKSVAGRLFIKFYYSVSPWLVLALSHIPAINLFIRVVLDKFIITIKKK
jgi:hypothetical protein